MNRSDNLTDRAYAIADEASLALIRCEGIPIQGDDEPFFALCDEEQQEVSYLHDAAPYIREAFDYLAARGLAELRSDADGEYIHLKEPA